MGGPSKATKRTSGVGSRPADEAVAAGTGQPQPRKDFTHRATGAAMAVHMKFGPGLNEIHYHRAMSLALSEAGLAFEDDSGAVRPRSVADMEHA
jgi:hypothetical protein